MATILTNYGFEQTADEAWCVARSFADVDGSQHDVTVSFKQTENGNWVYLDPSAKLHYATMDVRDVLAFAQTVIASSVFEVTGVPVDEGFDYEGTWYTSPFMFGDYFDWKVELKDGKAWVAQPVGDYGVAYVSWRDDFAVRVEAGAAKAPETQDSQPRPPI